MVEVTVVKVEMKEVKTFPKLMTSNDGDVVFFTEPTIGMSLLTEGINEAFYSKNWNMDLFIDYNEELIIKNK
tara:strand:+ start:908 stop:1123 length:216 start_codon:yes stop_codon:yes gene_type:complete